jgi:hypothetical protein
MSTEFARRQSERREKRNIWYYVANAFSLLVSSLEPAPDKDIRYCRFSILTGERRPDNLEFINLFLGKYFGRLLGVSWIPKTIKLSRWIRC